MAKITLEEYLLENEAKKITNHAFSVWRDENNEIKIVVHPDGQNGKTIDLIVRGDNVETVSCQE